MKYVILSVVAILLFSGLAVCTSECPASDPKLQPEYDSCSLIRPLYFDIDEKPYSYTGEEILVNCTRRIQSTHEVSPLPNLYVNVIGYNKDLIRVWQKQGNTKSRGVFRFTPVVEGDYSIQIQGFKVPSTCKVKQNPAELEVLIKEDESPTAAAVAVEPEVVLPEPEVIPPEPEAVEEPGLLDFMVNGVGEEERKGGMSGLMLMLVSLLIS